MEYILNRERSGFPILCGWTEIDDPPLSPVQKQVNQMVRELPRLWRGNVYDAVTHQAAREHLIKHQPRVLYIGIQAPASLDALQRGIEAASRKLGYESEERAYSPHLTIGRARQHVTTNEQQSIRRTLEETRIDLLGTARVDSVHLYKSDLKPTGSVYTRLYSAPLKK